MAHALPAALPGNSTERLSALFDTHHERLYRLARRLVSNADDARDLVQETFLKAARSLSSVPAGVTSEEAWLVRVLINIRRDEWRKTAVRARHAGEAGGSMRATSDEEAAVVARRTGRRAREGFARRRRDGIARRE